MSCYESVIEQRVVQSGRLVFLYFFIVKNISEYLSPLHGPTSASAMLSYESVIEQRVVQSGRPVF